MHICYICNEYPPTEHGGIGVFVQTLARRLVSIDKKVCVVGFDSTVLSDIKENDQGVTVYRIRDPYLLLPKPRLGRFSIDVFDSMRRNYLSSRVDQLIRKVNVDLVESYDWSGPLGKKPDVPMVVRLHGANFAHAFYEKRKASVFLKRKEIRNITMADWRLSVSRHIGEITAQGMKRKCSYEVVYNGVDVDFFSPCDKVYDSNEILFVGTINRRKGIYHFLHSIPLILDRWPAAHFKFVGKMSNNDSAMISHEVALMPFDWRKKFTFVQHVPHADLPDIYRHASVVVFPSLAEAFGLTCVEAMACGKPVVVTSLASGPELIIDQQSGILADPANSEDFASAVLDLLKDASLREKMGRSARERVVDCFDIQKLTQKNAQIYQRILS